jgi:hypothetical protein
MSRKRIPISILAIALSACVVQPELLNSERIKQRFGSYGIELIDNSEDIRRANLYSIENESKVCRTYAVVHFDNVPHDLIGDEHAQILAGSSIGATFKANGWTVYKETRYIGDITIAEESAGVLQLMHLNSPQKLAMHVYRLLLKKESQIIDYATIIEAHHPDYLDIDDVRYLFMVDTPAQLTNSELKEYAALVQKQL